MHDKLVGRTAGIALTAKGVQQASKSAAIAATLNPELLIASPRERATQTAAAFGTACSLDINVNSQFEEFDFGAWTGLSFDVLSTFTEWRDFNSFRSAHSAPGGESILDVQYRATREVLRIHADQVAQTVIVVTHADVIRSVLAYFAGVPLDLFLRFTIDPASMSALELSGQGARICYVNR